MISRIGAEDPPVVRMERLRNQDPRPAGHPGRHHDRFGQGAGPVVEAGVGHFHPRELSDEGLVFEDGLEGSLTDFRLVGRIGREVLGARDQRVDHGGDEMVVRAGAQKVGEVLARRRSFAPWP